MAGERETADPRRPVFEADPARVGGLREGLRWARDIAAAEGAAAVVRRIDETLKVLAEGRDAE